MGFGLPDDGLHSPNEKYKIDNYYTGIMTIAHFFELMGERIQVRKYDASIG
jgi:acetylornithine deacetylase/succinyl-diaminopimelate desuccinylase-like protein